MSLEETPPAQQAAFREPVDVYTPGCWVTLNEDQQYEEYILVRQQITAILVRVETLEAALKRYGQHLKDCESLLSTRELSMPCSCGFEAVGGG